MKNFYTILTVLMTISALSSCAPKLTNSNPSVTNGNSPITNPTNPTNPTTPTSPVSGCSDGVFRDGATRCYYKNIPTIQVMGTRTAGSVVWSSTQFSSSGSGISPNQFATDGTFNLRIIPRLSNPSVAAANPSYPGKTCSSLHNATKLWVQVLLRQANATSGEIATLSASIDTPSSVWHFSPPVTAQPLVVEVISVLADIRCKQYGGTSYCPYADIPLNSPLTTYPTECVAFDLQYSTDETYDLPGATAN